MPPDWAGSGAKLGFSLEVEFSPNACAEYGMNKERLLGSGKPSFRAVEPLMEPTFISGKGQELVKVTQGAYECQLESLEAQLYSFRFFLDFPQGAVRNDVELPAERIFFLTQCWIDNPQSIDRARSRVKEIDKNIDKINREIVELGQESNVFQKALKLGQRVALVERREKLETERQEIQKTYPLERENLIEGPYGTLFNKRGVIAVKRFRGTMDTREQYHWVGTFALKEFFEDLDEQESGGG